METNILLNEIVSRETLEKLQVYKSLVLKWNAKTNLLSKNTNENSLDTHIIDCVDLALKMPQKIGHVLDIGSGAGLPGIVLSIYGIKNIILIESDLKKTVFLEEVKRIMNLDVIVLRERAEKIQNLKASVIVSRAMASCFKLINICEKMIDNESEVLLMKSNSQINELEELKTNWNFSLQILENHYINTHAVFHMKNLIKK